MVYEVERGGREAMSSGPNEMIRMEIQGREFYCHSEECVRPALWGREGGG